MSSKTFESIDHTRQLHVKPLDNHITLVINYKDAGRSGLTISHSDAPALALAILEAAYGSNQPAASKIGEAWAALYTHIADEERVKAEAKEREELEAEAMRLRNAWHNDPLDETPPPSNWLAVARKARELAKGSGE